MSKLDVLFVNPGAAEQVYQELSNKFSAIEVPVWSLLLAQSCRSKGFSVAILDCDAERLTEDQAIERIKYINPRLVCFVVYGSNPNAGTTSMTGASSLCKSLKQVHPQFKTCFVGSHTSALPKEVLALDGVDFVLLNEGVYALQNLLNARYPNDLHNVKGIGFKEEGNLILNAPERIVPHERMDIDLPGYAWDLLPYKEKPLDLYRAHFWHANFDYNKRTPFAALYTSLGCRFKCFPKGTKVVVADGPNRTINKLRVGDKLIGYNEKTGKIEQTTVTRVMEHECHDQLLKITFANGYTLRCTEEHPFYVHGKWVEAKNLQIGDEIHSIDSSLRVTKIERCRKPDGKRVYNVECSPHKNYFVCLSGGSDYVLSHNCDFCLEENTNIVVSNGCNKKAKDITKKDKLLSFDCDTNNVTESDILDISVREVESLLIITMSDGKSIKATKEHPFYVMGKWIDAGSLQIGDRCLVIDQSTNCPHYVSIKSITEINGKFKVYNFQCDPVDNYFAEYILVHNCMINILNRTNNDDGVSAANSSIMRFWSPEFIIQEFDKLVNMGVSTIRISDEMFFLDKRYFEPLLNLIIDRKYDLHMWIYSRVDTVRERYLEMFNKAGVKWVAAGVECASQKIRKEITKGTYEEVDIRDVIKLVRDHGINVIANYIYGLPDDTHETMKETLDLSLELNTEMMNCYPCMSLPGSPLYYRAKENGWKLPQAFSAWSFLSYDCLPMPTKHLPSSEVLKFRDEAWVKYFTRPEYLNMIESKFGLEQRNNIEEMTKIKLKRKLLEDPYYGSNETLKEKNTELVVLP